MKKTKKVNLLAKDEKGRLHAFHVSNKLFCELKKSRKGLLEPIFKGEITKE